MNNLVFMHGLNEEPYTTDKVIAECSNNNLHSVKVIIYNHKEDLEDFGVFIQKYVHPTLTCMKTMYTIQGGFTLLPVLSVFNTIDLQRRGDLDD